MESILFLKEMNELSVSAAKCKLHSAWHSYCSGDVETQPETSLAKGTGMCDEGDSTALHGNKRTFLTTQHNVSMRLPLA
jgi:hypothetical protein